MISRRRLLMLPAQGAASLALPCCASSPPLRKDVFRDFSDAARPYPRLATTLRERCHDYRIAYLLKTRPGDFFWTMLRRIATVSGRTGTYDFGPGCHLAEPVFAPLPCRSYGPQDALEPGFLLVEAYDSNTRRSFLAVFRAERIAAGPVATVHLRHHAPFSYRGWWSEATSSA